MSHDNEPASSASPPHSPHPPRPVTAFVVVGLSLVVIALSAWAAVQPGSDTAQTATMLWFHDPPQPWAAILAIANPLVRPVPLAVVSALLLCWALLTAHGPGHRLEICRALILAVALSEVVAQVAKRLVDQPRPLSVIPGLDSHGYPKDPNGNAYPSAHTAVAVAVVCALWPWLSWPQRVVAAAFAMVVATNRLYIGAHWPIDIIGGAAIGLLSGAVAWLVAARWPIGAHGSHEPDGAGAGR
jgi:membrane-associated phospholipid phosphatase